MPISGNESEYSIITREVVYPYDVVMTEFDSQGITVNDEEQVFTVVVRTNGRDTILGDFGPDAEIVFQFKEVTTPSEL